MCSIRVNTRKHYVKTQLNFFHPTIFIVDFIPQDRRRQTKRKTFRVLFSQGDHVGAHLICGGPCAPIKFKIQGRVNEPASRRNRYSNVRSHINIYGKFAGARQRKAPAECHRPSPWLDAFAIRFSQQQRRFRHFNYSICCWQLKTKGTRTL